MRRCASQILLFAALATTLATGAVGCRAYRGPARTVPLPPNTRPEELVDADDPAESLNPLTADELTGAAEELKAVRKRKAKAAGGDGKTYEFLLLSGGAVYGAYSAGVLAGWTAHGSRPQFDVVTGISTGALIAPFAFLGPQYDGVVRGQYTSVTNKDLFTIRRQVRALFAESIADVSPFRDRLYQTIDYTVIRAVAAEHAKGRRCFVGSTNLDTKRLIVWDLGAIAARNTPADDILFREAIIASASIPGFFPTVRFQVLIDNMAFEELHVDGGISQSMFFRAPHVEPSKREAFGPQSLAGSNLFMLVAGKLFPDPEGVKPRTISVVGAGVSALLYASGRQDLYRLYLLSILTGMNYYYAAIPPDFKTTANSTNFDPVEMQKMYAEGFKRGAEGVILTEPVARQKEKEGANKNKPDATAADKKKPKYGAAWQVLPPGLEAGDELRTRTGLRLKTQKKDPAEPVQPASTDGAGAAPKTAAPGSPPVAK